MTVKDKKSIKKWKAKTGWVKKKIEWGGKREKTLYDKVKYYFHSKTLGFFLRGGLGKYKIILLEQYWKCTFWGNSFENVSFEGLILKIYFLRKLFQK